MREDIKKRIAAVRRGEMPDGYIETMAGVIPSDWSNAPLSKISDVLSEQAGEQVFETLSISAGIGFVNQAEKFGKELSGKQYTKYTVLRRGNFAYNKGNSKRYPQGCTYMLKERDEAAVPNVFECFRITQGHPEYYEQLFINGFMNKQLTRKINHGVRDDGLLNLTDEDFYSTVMPIPSLAEQKKIAEVLATCDQVIELKQQLLEEKRRQKQWLMQKLLDPNSGVHLPGFECTKWTETPLASICKFIGGGTPDTSNEHYWNGTIPWISSADLQDGNIHSVHATRFITEEAVKNSATKICPKDSILIVSRVGVGKIAIAPVELCTSQDFTNLVDVNGNLYFITLQIQREIQRILTMTQGTSIKGIASKEIKAVAISLPSRSEQDAIAKVLECSDREISLSEKEIKAWQQKKKALMQLLLTGLVRTKY
ncbi:MAG: hypothetical protein E7547_07780 [Ruminococcaceae bacterium]|nr:hypothetical protein [Oscillospiraceae bacterium]